MSALGAVPAGFLETEEEERPSGVSSPSSSLHLALSEMLYVYSLNPSTPSVSALNNSRFTEEAQGHCHMPKVTVSRKVRDSEHAVWL